MSMPPRILGPRAEISKSSVRCLSSGPAQLAQQELVRALELVGGRGRDRARPRRLVEAGVGGAVGLAPEARYPPGQAGPAGAPVAALPGRGGGEGAGGGGAGGRRGGGPGGRAVARAARAEQRAEGRGQRAWAPARQGPADRRRTAPSRRRARSR